MKYNLRDKYLIIEIESLFYKTVQDFFDELVPSKKIQHLLITNGWILMDDLKVKRETVLDGKYLSILLYPTDNNYKKEENDEVKVVYEDEIILVVDKPANLIVHSDNSKDVTLTNKVRSLYRNEPYTFNPVHRLDKETSGLIVYSKSEIFQPLLDEYINDKKIQRIYLAFVKANIDKGKKFSFDDSIGRDRHNAKKMIAYKGGQEAHTSATCISNKDGISVLKCLLKTGRTHQIRVHLSTHKFPIINDELYGVAYPKCRHMGLVASELRFYHPLKEEDVKLYANIPYDLDNLM